MADKILVTGATGGVAQKIVKDLLAKGVAVTAYVRSKDKCAQMFGDSAGLSIVEGGYDDLKALKHAMPGHTRVFLMCADLPRMAEIKTNIAVMAYDAGVKQIVDLSSRFTQFPWRTSFIGESHLLAEKQIYELALKKNRFYVAIRPSRFMSNHFWVDAMSIKEEKLILDCQPADALVEWISPDDISDVSTAVLTDPVEKHVNFGYTLIGDNVSNAKRAELWTKALGQKITYKPLTPVERYNSLLGIGLPHPMAFDLSSVPTNQPPNLVVPILLGRPYQKLEEWIEKNKDALMT
ncbi:hypothetical protein BC940DRAFT_268156 [Gongronella butleri]|nr:hypothetical protein BC940DRAFT_268156 [Gongronella butleri]